MRWTKHSLLSLCCFPALHHGHVQMVTVAAAVLLESRGSGCGIVEGPTHHQSKPTDHRCSMTGFGRVATQQRRGLEAQLTGVHTSLEPYSNGVMKRVAGCGIESATAASGLECRLENNQSERGGGRARTDATTTMRARARDTVRTNAAELGDSRRGRQCGKGRRGRVWGADKDIQWYSGHLGVA